MTAGLSTLRRAPRALATVFGLAAVLATVALAATVAPAAAQAPDPAALMERAAERYRSAGTVCADFRQVLSVPLLNQEREGHGRLCQKRPNLLSMRFAEPAGDLVVVDGEHVWIYYPSRDPDQVLKTPVAAAAGARGLDFHREFLEDAERRYALEHGGTETVDGVRVHRITLRPRGDARYTEAVAWIGADDPLLHRVEIREENGSVRTIHLSAIELDAVAPAGTFSFTPPPGARIITP